MGICELCGIEDKTVVIKIAGTKMHACNKCSTMGLKVDDEGPSSFTFRKKLKESQNLDVIADYSKILNQALSKKKLNVHQVARVLNIRESTIQKYFTSKLKPDVKTAKKLESYFNIKLIVETDEQEIVDFIEKESSNVGLSLGDLLKKKLEESK